LSSIEDPENVSSSAYLVNSSAYLVKESAVRGATRGGRVVMVGLPPTGEKPPLLSLVIVRELELVGSFRFNDEIDEVLAALADGSLQVDPIDSHEFPVEDVVEACEVARDSAHSGKVLLRF
jgi:L-idonate 5-dehydrogenase